MAPTTCRLESPRQPILSVDGGSCQFQDPPSRAFTLSRILRPLRDQLHSRNLQQRMGIHGCPLLQSQISRHLHFWPPTPNTIRAPFNKLQLSSKRQSNSLLVAGRKRNAYLLPSECMYSPHITDARLPMEIESTREARALGHDPVLWF